MEKSAKLLTKITAAILILQYLSLLINILLIAVPLYSIDLPESNFTDFTLSGNEGNIKVWDLSAHQAKIHNNSGDIDIKQGVIYVYNDKNETCIIKFDYGEYKNKSNVFICNDNIKTILNTKNGRIKFNTDYIFYDGKKIIKGDSSSVITYKNFKLKSEKIFIDLNKQNLLVSGNVNIDDLNKSLKLLCDNLYCEYKKGEGKIYGDIELTADEYRILSDTIIFTLRKDKVERLDFVNNYKIIFKDYKSELYGNKLVYLENGTVKSDEPSRIKHYDYFVYFDNFDINLNSRKGNLYKCKVSDFYYSPELDLQPLLFKNGLFGEIDSINVDFRNDLYKISSFDSKISYQKYRWISDTGIVFYNFKDNNSIQTNNFYKNEIYYDSVSVFSNLISVKMKNKVIDKLKLLNGFIIKNTDVTLKSNKCIANIKIIKNKYNIDTLELPGKILITYSDDMQLNMQNADLKMTDMNSLIFRKGTRPLLVRNNMLIKGDNFSGEFVNNNYYFIFDNDVEITDSEKVNLTAGRLKVLVKENQVKRIILTNNIKGNIKKF